VAAVREWNELHKQVAESNQPLDYGEIETVDSVTDPHAMSRATYNGLIEGLRANGLPDSAEKHIRELDAGIRTDRPTTGDGRACQIAKDRLLADPDFARKVLSNDIKANAMLADLNRVIVYAGDDGKPASEYLLKKLADRGLR
jgi:hypothetical protein